MPSDPDQQIPLEVSRGTLAAIVVVISIGLFESWGDRVVDPLGNRPGHAFGSWTTPEIVPILEDSVHSDELGIRIDHVDDYAFFLLDHPGDGRGPSTVSFINRKQSILGEISRFDPATQTWPPIASDFGTTVSLKRAPEDPNQATAISVGPQTDFRLQVQTILYGDTKIIWASPRKSPAWPLRIHIGKCEIGAQTLRIALYELQATTPEPEYTSGPIGAIATALRAL